MTADTDYTVTEFQLNITQTFTAFTVTASQRDRDIYIIINIIIANVGL